MGKTTNRKITKKMDVGDTSNPFIVILNNDSVPVPVPVHVPIHVPVPVKVINTGSMKTSNIDSIQNVDNRFKDYFNKHEKHIIQTGNVNIDTAPIDTIPSCDYYVIHCDEHTERDKHVAKIKGKINSKNFNMFKAYYTKDNSLDSEEQIKYLKQIDKNLSFEGDFRFYKPGQIGVYLSHHMIIKNIMDNIQKGNVVSDYSLIMEDDVKIPLQVKFIMELILNEVKNLNFDIIYLGNLNNNFKSMIKNSKLFGIYTLDTEKWCWGAHALLINNKNAEKIYNLNCKIKLEIDNQYKVLGDDKKLNVFVTKPSLFTQDRANCPKSTIS